MHLSQNIEILVFVHGCLISFVNKYVILISHLFYFDFFYLRYSLNSIDIIFFAVSKGLPELSLYCCQIILMLAHVSTRTAPVHMSLFHIRECPEVYATP